MNKQHSAGFSLIELMIVVAIIGIMASIAYPSYVSSVLKGKRAEGRAALAELMQQEERYMTQMNTYLSFTNSAGTTVPAGAATTFKTFSGDSLAKAAYLLKASTCDSTTNINDCVMVEAVPRSTDAEAGTLQMLSTGVKTCTGGTTPSVCWK
jgi:type IV pilus assembly protein PilE